MFKLNTSSLLVPVLVACTSLLSVQANAFSIRIDLTLAFCTENVAAGPRSVAVGGYNFTAGDDSSACGDTSRLDPYQLNVGGDLYDEIYLNNDGLITLGSAFGGATTDVTSALFGPAFAPLYRDGAYVAGGNGRVSWGGSASPSSEGLMSINYEGTTSTVQVNIINRAPTTGMNGDFDLEFNYTNDSDPVFFGDVAASVGFNNGAGQSFLLPGSGVAGAFEGNPADCGSVGVSSTALACNNLSPNGDGQYIFQFRNGFVTNLPTSSVPEPSLFGLALLGLGLLGRRKAR